MKPWSRINHQPYRDYHKTLSLTYHLLSTLPPQLVHQYCVHLFGETTCTKGKDGRNIEWKQEVTKLANAIPPLNIPSTIQHSIRPANFDHTLVSLFQTINPQPTRTPEIFYLALVGEEPKEEDVLAFYYALKNICLHENNMKWHVFCYLLRLIRWEWEDRTRLHLQILDLGFKFNAGQIRAIWCCFACFDNKWRQELSNTLYERRYIWHPDLINRTRNAPFDLASFILLIKQLTYKDDQSDFMSSRIMVLLLQSSFGAVACQALGYFFTREQWCFIYEHEKQIQISNMDDVITHFILKATSSM